MKLAGKKRTKIEEIKDPFSNLPPGVMGYAPIFDITPAGLVHRVITESGVLTTSQAVEIGRTIARLKDEILEGGYDENRK
jgi:methylthioribose-1-phosphate isomerase